MGRIPFLVVSLALLLAEEVNEMRYVATLTILLALLLPGRLVAHEGHEHKVMGVVTAVQGSEFQIEAKDGKTASLTPAEGDQVLPRKDCVDRGRPESRRASGDLLMWKRKAKILPVRCCWGLESRGVYKRCGQGNSKNRTEGHAS